MRKLAVDELAYAKWVPTTPGAGEFLDTVLEYVGQAAQGRMAPKDALEEAAAKGSRSSTATRDGTDDTPHDSGEPEQAVREGEWRKRESSRAPSVTVGRGKQWPTGPRDSEDLHGEPLR